MANSSLSTVLHYLVKLADAPPSGPTTDLQLLRRFVGERDQDAFGELVRRHGPLVLSVCRRMLAHEQDAEDAFQAAFLVLARRAASIRKGESVGSFLYGVAYRIAMKERKKDTRRRGRERGAERPSPAGPEYEAAWRELQTLLDEGLDRMPGKYRTPFVLCCLQGMSKSEAARELGWKEGTVSSRLAKARERLRILLSRKGVTLAAALTSVGVAGGASGGCVPPALAASCVGRAVPFTFGPSPSGAEAARAVRMAEAALNGMTTAGWKAATMLVLTACLAAAGGVLGTPSGQTKRADDGPRNPPEAAAKAHRDGDGDPLPDGAVARLGTARFRFTSAGAAFLPGGKTVVSVELGGPIQFWEPRTGRLLREIDTGRFQAGQPGGFAVSADGKRLAVSGSIQGDGKPGWRSAAAVFDLATGKAIRVVERSPIEGVNGVTLSPDGKMLFTLGRDGKLRVEEVSTGAELLQQRFPGDVMAHLVVSPDGSLLAVGSGPNTQKILVWKWEAAGVPREVASGWHRGRELAFSPDGKLLAECSDAQPDVRIIDVASGRLLRKLELPDHEPYRHYHVAFAPGGKLLAAYGGTNDRASVHLWNPTTGAFVKRLDIGGALAFSPDGTLLVAGSQVWDFATGKDLSANPEAHRGAVDSVVTGPKGLVVTTGGDNTLRLWDLATARQRRRMAPDESAGSSILAVTLSPDGTRLVSVGSRGDGVSLWDVTTGKRVYRLAGHGSSTAAAVFLPDGKSFLTWGAADMCLRRWDIRTGKALSEHVIRPDGLPVPGEDDEPREKERHFLFFGGAGFTPDAKSLIFQIRQKWYVFDAATGKPQRSFPCEWRSLAGMAVSPDGKLILASARGRPIEIELPGGGRQSTSPKTHSLTLWTLATGEVHKQVTLPEENPGPVAFSPDGKIFAAASSRPGARIRLLETGTGREVRKIEGFRGTVRSLAFTPDGKRLVSGMKDSSALVWDLTPPR